MLWTWIAVAHAAPVVDLPSTGTTTLWDALVQVDEGGVIRVQDDYTFASSDWAVFIQKDVTIESLGDQVEIPPLFAQDAHVTLRNVALRSMITTDQRYYAEDGTTFAYCYGASCGWWFERGSLVLDTVLIEGIDVGIALRTDNTPVTATALQISDCGAPQPMRMESSVATVKATLTDLVYTGNTGPLTVFADVTQGELELTLANPTFEGPAETIPQRAGALSLEDVQATIIGGRIAGYSLSAGSAVLVEGSNVTVTGMVLDEVHSQGEGAGFLLEEGGGTLALHLSGITAENMSATQGGLVRQSNGVLSLSGVLISGVSATKGAAVYVDNASSVEIADVRASDLSSTSRGTLLYGSGLGRLTLDRVQLCGSQASPSLIDVSANSITASNLALYGNDQADAALHLAAGSIELQFMTLVGDGRGDLIQVSASETLQIHSNILVDADTGVLRSDTATNMLIDHNLWSQVNDHSPGVPTSRGALDGDPGFVGSFDALDCASWPFLRPDSAAVDSAHPDYQDQDGTAADRGAFGGMTGGAESWDLETPPIQDTGDPPDSPRDSGADSGDWVAAPPTLGGGLPGCMGGGAFAILLAAGLFRRQRQNGAPTRIAERDGA